MRIDNKTNNLYVDKKRGGNKKYKMVYIRSILRDDQNQRSNQYRIGSLESAWRIAVNACVTDVWWY